MKEQIKQSLEIIVARIHSILSSGEKISSETFVALSKILIEIYEHLDDETTTVEKDKI